MADQIEAIPIVAPSDLVKLIRSNPNLKPTDIADLLEGWFKHHLIEVASDAIFDSVALAIQKIPEHAIIQQAMSQNMPGILNTVIRQGLFSQDINVKEAPKGARAVRHVVCVIKMPDMVGPEEISMNGTGLEKKKSPLLVVK